MVEKEEAVEEDEEVGEEETEEEDGRGLPFHPTLCRGLVSPGQPPLLLRRGGGPSFRPSELQFPQKWVRAKGSRAFTPHYTPLWRLRALPKSPIPPRPPGPGAEVTPTQPASVACLPQHQPLPWCHHVTAEHRPKSVRRRRRKERKVICHE